MSWLRRMWSRKFDQSSDDDYYREIQIPRFFLATSGIWTEHVKTNRIRFSIFVTILILFAALPRLLGLFTIVNENQLFYQIGSLLFYVNVICAMFLLRFNSDIRRSVLAEMRDDWETTHDVEDKQVMQYYAEYSRKVSLLVITVRGVSLIGKSLNPLITSIIRGDNMSTGKKKYPFLPSGTFFDTVSSICYLIARIVSTVTMIGIDTFFAILTIHTCGQLVILAKRITRYRGQTHHQFGENIPRTCSCLKCIVDSHVRICDFVKRIDNYFYIVFFMRLLVGVIDLACSGFELSKAIAKGEYAYLMTFVISTLSTSSTFLINCSVAETCQQAGYALGDAAYSVEWITKQPRILRHLIFIIRQTRLPLKFTAGKYFILSRSLFKEYFLTAMSYISTLITIKLGK
ncbi:uncharacterized protein LOC107036721 isoform X2 [Diachasma alloeum]|uniref:uncharacterized protein LOC107036721 isoform X2 n=1 Tax=Diachasma alloeum TaxID=454923 RepID=UPI0010FB6C79|nr:uncharacterized protein LOC107036721 isoform X2 [Diachasma alloeum]